MGVAGGRGHTRGLRRSCSLVAFAGKNVRELVKAEHSASKTWRIVAHTLGPVVQKFADKSFRKFADKTFCEFAEVFTHESTTIWQIQQWEN